MNNTVSSHLLNGRLLHLPFLSILVHWLVLSLLLLGLPHVLEVAVTGVLHDSAVGGVEGLAQVLLQVLGLAQVEEIGSLGGLHDVFSGPVLPELPLEVGALGTPNVDVLLAGLDPGDGVLVLAGKGLGFLGDLVLDDFLDLASVNFW